MAKNLAPLPLPPSLRPTPAPPQSSLPSCATNFLYYIPYFLSTSLCNCNTNSYCDLCWYQWQPPQGCPVATCPPPSRRLQDATGDVLHYSALGPDIMLYWIRVVTVIVGFAASLPLSVLHRRTGPGSFRYPSLLRFTVANGESVGRREWNPGYCAVRGSYEFY